MKYKHVYLYGVTMPCGRYIPQLLIYYTTKRCFSKEEIPLFLEEKLSFRTKMRTTSGNFDFGLDSAAEIW